MIISPSTESTPSTGGKRAAQQRYRYFEEAPERIAIPANELLERIPDEYCLPVEGGGQLDRRLELPCRELFSGNVPRLSLSVLQGLAPDMIRIPEGTDGALRLALPAGWLALHYRLINRREELPPEPGSVPEPEEQIQKDFLMPPLVLEPSETGASKEEIKIESATHAENDSLTFEQSSEKTGDGLTPINQVPVEKEKKRGFFASLPIFRRHRQESESTVKVAANATPSVVGELTPPKAPENERQLPAVKQAEGVSSKEMPITLERLWKLDPTDQLADASALQALFMTEEKLTLERVMGLAGQLPGLKACVLAHGDQVVCASNNPAGIDQRALSSQAMTMLSQIRDSSAKMGLGSVPAITLHAEEGILSFLYQGELCLLVLHADRGFVPGVRERLQEMLGHLSSAKALPGGASAQSSLPI
ncbi:MAG: hypothetical protein WCP60_08205 [bacterium]